MLQVWSIATMQSCPNTLFALMSMSVMIPIWMVWAAAYSWHYSSASWSACTLDILLAIIFCTAQHLIIMTAECTAVAIIMIGTRWCKPCCHQSFVTPVVHLLVRRLVQPFLFSWWIVPYHKPSMSSFLNCEGTIACIKADLAKYCYFHDCT